MFGEVQDGGGLMDIKLDNNSSHLSPEEERDKKNTLTLNVWGGGSTRVEKGRNWGMRKSKNLHGQFYAFRSLRPPTLNHDHQENKCKCNKLTYTLG